MKLCALVSFAVVNQLVKAHNDGLPINPELGVPGFPDCVQVQSQNGQSNAFCLYCAACMKLAVKQGIYVILTVNHLFKTLRVVCVFVCWDPIV